MADLTSQCGVCGAANDAHATTCVGCGRALPPALLSPGTLLNGSYRIRALAGSGGMGAVYKAADTRLGGRLVALKEMSEHGLTPQEIAEASDAFRREALLLASLHHDSIPSIHDHFNAGGRWYLVMDFIEGETLEHRLDRTGRTGLALPEMLRLADQLCAVLEFLHRQSPPIIFRDLKPSNVMVTASDHLYLIDFGIARLFKFGQAHDTIALGTPGYAAPEQLGKTQTSVRSDIFSLGVLLHELLTGLDPSIKPFSFAPIRPVNPQTPPELEALILQMVQLDASKRPSSVTEVRQELQQIATRLSAGQSAGPRQHAAPRIPSPGNSFVSPSPMPVAYPNAPVSGHRGRSNRVVFTLLGAGVAMLCVVAMICSASGSALQAPAQSSNFGSTTSSQGSPTADQATLSGDEDTLKFDVSTLHDDVAMLASDTNTYTDMSAYATDWKQMQSDYRQEQRDYQQGCGSYGENASTVALDANTVALDENSIQLDDNSLKGSENELNIDLSNVKTDIATIQTDLQTLQNDAGGSTGDSAVATSVTAADTALANAQQQLDASNKALKNANAQASTYDKEAAQLKTDAQNLANSMHC